MQSVLYVEVNFVCIAILFMLFLRDAKQRNNDDYHILFTKVLFSNIAFFVSDIAWGLMATAESPDVMMNWAVNIVYFSMSSIAGYYWLIFEEKMIDPNYLKNKSAIALRMLPPTLLIILSVSSVKTRWLFYIDAAGQYQRGSLYLLQPILAYSLPIYATVRAVQAFVKTKNFDQKYQYRSLAMFYILPAIGGILQIIIKGTPMLNIGITLSGLWVYFAFQDNVIMVDSLTKINNRRYFDKMLEEMIRSYNIEPNKHLWLIMMDVDYFKKINDGFGHAEGDRALVMIAEVLKNAGNEFNCVAARIGGDEFAICCLSENIEIPKEICAHIKKELFDKTANNAFKLQLSYGYAEYIKDMSSQQLYISADKELYQAKKSR